MNDSRRIISSKDRQRLVAAIDVARRSWLTYGPHLDWLKAELMRADVRDPVDVPQDVVAMNSYVTLRDLHTGQTSEMRLAFGRDGSAEEEVCVFEPLGMALLGRRSGDLISWQEEDRLRIAKLCKRHNRFGTGVYRGEEAESDNFAAESVFQTA